MLSYKYININICRWMISEVTSCLAARMTVNIYNPCVVRNILLTEFQISFSGLQLVNAWNFIALYATVVL